MEHTDLEAWRRHCSAVSTGSEADGGVLASDWVGAGITPPPARGSPAARIPLERALRLAEEADALEGRERVARLEEAIAWLDCPYPRTPPELVAAIRRQRARLVEKAGE